MTSDDIDLQEATENAVDDTLEALRDQRDEKQELDLQGEETVNPQVFANAKHYVIGPVHFASKFEKAPNVVFGQRSKGFDDKPTNQLQASAFAPFLLQPYVYQWRFDNGAVDGFWIGLYALTDPASNLDQHAITWRAAGTASSYLEMGVTNQWTENYELTNSPPSFLEEEVAPGEYEE